MGRTGPEWRRVGQCSVYRYSDDEIESKVQDMRESLLLREMPPPKGKQDM